MSPRFTVLSRGANARRLDSREKAADLNPLLFYSSIVVQVSVAMSQSLMVLSHDPDARMRESYERLVKQLRCYALRTSPCRCPLRYSRARQSHPMISMQGLSSRARTPLTRPSVHALRASPCRYLL